MKLLFRPMLASLFVITTFCACSLELAAQEASTTPHVGLERAFPKLRFHRPVFLTGAGDNSKRLFIVEQDGVIHSINSNANDDQIDTTKVALDMRFKVCRKGNEEGLLGLAFHPDFQSNGEVYIHYSSSEKDMYGVVSRFRISPSDPETIDPDSEEVLLELKQPFRNHNGGSIAFGPDGYLYISFGDGGKANDPLKHGQNLKSWFGAILRIDVDHTDPGKPYRVPDDNPFVGNDDAAPEIWALGLRNVWRFSFDRETGELWAGDVGQDRFDEISLIRKGGNYGWNRYEARSDFRANAKMATDKHDEPVAFYGREWGLSVTGGAVYSGLSISGTPRKLFLWRLRLWQHVANSQTEWKLRKSTRPSNWSQHRFFWRR